MSNDDKNTQEFEEARKAVLPLFFDAVRQSSPNLGADLQNSLASIGASLVAKNALDSQSKNEAVSQPPPLPTTAPPAKQKTQSKQETNAIIQLSLPIKENVRPVSNIAARAALFAAIQGEDRELLNDVVLAAQEGIKIIFSGQQLNQDDHDLFMQLVYLANHKPLGELVKIPANAILAGLGRGTGKSQHEQLKAEMYRLVKATVNLKAYGINYIGHLLDAAFQDEMEAQNSRHWNYRLNPELAGLFGKSQFSLIDWEQRKKLKQKDLARWLHLYLLSHSAPFPVSVAFLHKISGSRTKELWKFRENLRKAFEALKEAGIITSWAIAPKSDLVTIERLASITQLASPTEQSPPSVIQESDRYLQTVTIEKFRKAYPRLDPYACKSEFDLWLVGKTNPKSYDSAFLGFAKKWAEGKL